jgi:hypothetical protein
MRNRALSRGQYDPLVRSALARGSSGGAIPPALAAIAFNDLFGLGQDGAVVVAAPAAGFVGGDYTNFTLNAGVTLTGAAERPILIRATGTITINGTIDASGLISTLASFNQPTVGQMLFSPGGSGGGGGGNAGAAGQPGQQPQVAQQTSLVALVTFQALHPVGFTLGLLGGFAAAGIAGAVASPGGNAGAATGPTLGAALQSFIDLQRIRTGVVIEQYVGGTPGGIGTDGGSGGNGANGIVGGNGGTSAIGGNGGASIYLVAPTIVFGPGATLRSNGAAGGAGGNGANGNPGGGANSGSGGGGGGGGGQGGSGGVIAVLWGATITGGFAGSVTGGAGGAAGTAGAGGAAGGGPQPGGNGSAGTAGIAGSSGFIFGHQIGRH